MSPTRRRVLVAGAGLTGLSAAHLLGDRLEVVLAEASGALGGKIRTVSLRDRPLDAGPDVFITRNPAAEQLCRSLGLGDQLLAPAVAAAAVYANGAVRRLPSGLALGIPTDFTALRRSGIVSAMGAARAAFDLIPGRRLPADLGQAASGGSDQSIGAVVGRRLGKEVSDRLVGPLLGGINAGDVARLSFEATAPDLARAVAGRRRLSPALRRFSAPAGRVTTSPTFLGLKDGLGALVDALEKACLSKGVTILRQAPVSSLQRTGDGFEAVVGGRPERFAGVLLALPAHGAAPLLTDVAPEVSSELAAIAYAGVVTVTLAWDEAVVPPPGRQLLATLSGVLIPRGPSLSTALTFVSAKWPRSARPGEVVVRASAGHDGDSRALELGDEELVRSIRAEVQRLLGIATAPLAVHVERYPDSFPEYVVGHLARLARIEELLGGVSDLALAGAWGRGLGIPACVESATRASERLAAALGR